MAYFDPKTLQWMEGNPPDMPNIDLRQEYARPLNVVLNDMYSTPVSDYPAPQKTIKDLVNPVSVQQQPQAPQFVPPANDEERFQQAYDFKMSQPATASYLRNNTTGAVQMLPSFVRQPAMQQQPQNLLRSKSLMI